MYVNICVNTSEMNPHASLEKGKLKNTSPLTADKPCFLGAFHFTCSRKVQADVYIHFIRRQLFFRTWWHLRCLASDWLGLGLVHVLPLFVASLLSICSVFVSVMVEATDVWQSIPFGWPLGLVPSANSLKKSCFGLWSSSMWHTWPSQRRHLVLTVVSMVGSPQNLHIGSMLSPLRLTTK